MVHVGEYAAEVEVGLIDGDAGWPPYLSASDAEKLDGVLEALERGDLERASKFARVFRLTPVRACSRLDHAVTDVIQVRAVRTIRRFSCGLHIGMTCIDGWRILNGTLRRL